MLNRLRDDELETFVYWLKSRFPKYTLSLKSVAINGKPYIEAMLYDFWGNYYLPIATNDITSALKHIKSGLENSQK